MAELAPLFLRICATDICGLIIKTPNRKPCEHAFVFKVVRSFLQQGLIDLQRFAPPGK